jgi:hypothetical protein
VIAVMTKKVINKMIKILKQLFKNLENTKKHRKFKNQGKKWTLMNLRNLFKKKYKIRDIL